MRLTDFLEDIGNPVVYYPKLATVTGGVLPNLFLCQMYYWLGKQKDDEGWIYKTQTEIEQETGLTRREQESARKSLKARGLLKEQFKGCPRRLEFWLNKDALNTCWEAYIGGTDLPTQEVPKAWSRKSDQNVQNVQYIMADSANIECTKSAIYNAQNVQYIMADSAITECPNPPLHNAPNVHTVMADQGNISIYTENTSKTTSEITTEKEDTPTPQTKFAASKPEPVLQDPHSKELSSLLKKSESTPQTENSDLDTKVAVKFENIEQPNIALLPQPTNKYNAAKRCDELFKPKALPAWRISDKDFESEFVEYWRSMLAKSSEWRDRGIEPMIGDAKRSLKRMEKFDLEGVADLWEAYLERKQIQKEKQLARAQLEPESEHQNTPPHEPPAPPPELPPELRKKLDAARLKSQEEQKRRLDKIKREAKRAS